MFYLFSTQFYSKLTSTTENQHRNVSRWTKDVNIFDGGKILLVPINEPDPVPHWYLVMVLLPDRNKDSGTFPYIAVLDSIDGKRDAEGGIIRNYLLEELKTKENMRSSDFFGLEKELKKMEIIYPKIPRQLDSSSCGLFVIFYVKNIVTSYLKNGMSQILRNRETWFENGEIKRMRFELACKIIESAASQGKTIDMPTFQLFPTPAEDRAEKSKWRENIDPDTSYSEYIEHIKRTQTDITLRRTYNF